MNMLIERQLKEMANEAIREKFKDTRWSTTIGYVKLQEYPGGEIGVQIVFNLKEK